MEQVNLIQKISDLFTQMALEVSDKSKMGLTDINIIAEDVMVPILSIIYSTELINLNSEKSNYPGIDLATKDSITYVSSADKIAFQITSTNSSEKIRSTITRYIANDLHKKYDRVYICNLVSKQSRYSAKFQTEINNLTHNKIIFSLRDNIFDRGDLIKKIGNLTPLSKIKSIFKLLEDQFVYNRKSLLSLDIWNSDGVIGYGLNNFLHGMDRTTYQSLLRNQLPKEGREILDFILNRFRLDFDKNYLHSTGGIFHNLGFNTYLKAGFIQAEISYSTVKGDVSADFSIDTLSQRMTKSFSSLSVALNEGDFPLLSQPINHPAIQFLKKVLRNIFEDFNIDERIVDSYIRHFNDNIYHTVVTEFGEDLYKQHLEVTHDKWIQENERDLLFYTRNLGKLGFVEDEELMYQEAYGVWQDVRTYGLSEEEYVLDNKSSRSTTAVSKEGIIGLKPIESMINEYFESFKGSSDGYLNNVLFLIADFGKGKTSFLHHYASKLAEDYLRKHEGPFPVYFNLNQYDRYSNSPSLGVIANFLAKGFKIDIKDDYFRKKDYIFLIDSLDECGELTEGHIEKVMKDILEIQNLDILHRRENKIIVSSRPIAKGLREQIVRYKPFCISIEKDSKIEKADHYISVYGFKEDQFEEYVNYAIKGYLKKSQVSLKDFSGLSKDIIGAIYENRSVELYKTLHERVLKTSELRRPIFAYMIYKLLVSNSNFIDLGKVGVYISFLNQLSRDAKHKDDVNHKVRLQDEFVYRNILHASSLLWQYRRQSGEQTTLTKADICRTIEEDEIDKDDRKVLANFKDIESIHFLSHSYLGERESTLHFQHQSFAEILLAEYYVKVLLRYSIEENSSFEEAHVRLSIGLPTDQTIEFFRGLLMLIKECVLGNPDDKVIYAKRELLMPLLASMAIQKHNKRLYSTRLNATWFERFEEQVFVDNRIDRSMVYEFPIAHKILNRMSTLCTKIISSDRSYHIERPTIHTILFMNELIGLSSLKGKYYEMDKWFALTAGNILITDATSKVFFNFNIDGRKLLDMLYNWSNNFGSNPEWSRDLFMGLNLKDNERTYLYNGLKLYNVDFSFGYFRNLLFRYCDLREVNFSNSTIDKLTFEYSDISRTCFDDIVLVESESGFDLFELEGPLNITFSFISQGVLFPRKLNNVLKGSPMGIANFGSDDVIISRLFDSKAYPFFDEYLLPLKDIFRYILSRGYDVGFILSAFKFEDHVRAEEENSQELGNSDERLRQFLESLSSK